MSSAAFNAARIAALVVVLLLAAAVVLWTRCGIRGCPDVNRLNGYVPGRASVLRDHTGQEIGRLFLIQRVKVRLDSLPRYVPAAFVAMEDHRFWEHGGVDWVRVFGAAFRNIRELDIKEGSSTITMQVARNVFPDRLPASRRTMTRKTAEARVAQLIEAKYSKKEILELYLNEIYFGNGAYGIQAAAQEYFGKHAAELTLPEAATLAALPRAPSRLNPRTNPDLSLTGRRVVLKRMTAEGFITSAQASGASNARMRLRRDVLRGNATAPYFVDVVRRELEDELGDVIYTDGYTIETTLDLKTQRIAEEELSRQLAAIESGAYGKFRHATYASVRDTVVDVGGMPYLQGAVVFMDPRTGDVRALIGGRDYSASQYNRALQAKRQPASTFKPFVFAAAVAAGYPPSLRLSDEPLRLKLDGQRVWVPKNEDGIYAGVVTMRQALAVSSNVATVRLAMEVGLDRIIEMAHRIGVSGRIPAVPSVVLGAVELTPLELTSAYATLATLGSHPQPRFVTRVLDANGNIVWQRKPALKATLDPAVAFVVTHMLKDVIDRGTATSVRATGYQGVVAGKTGTSNGVSDLWFVGYTPDLVGTIWLGFDKRSTVVRGGKSGDMAAPIWGRIMARLGERSRDWPVPAGLETRHIDDAGRVYASNCGLMGLTRLEYFLMDTAPAATCHAEPHTDSIGSLVDSRPVKKAWLQRLRRRLFRATDADPPARSERQVARSRPDSLGRGTTLFRDTTLPISGDSAHPSLRDTIRDTLRASVPDTLRPDTLQRRDTIQKRDTTTKRDTTLMTTDSSAGHVRRSHLKGRDVFDFESAHDLSGDPRAGSRTS